MNVVTSAIAPTSPRSGRLLQNLQRSLSISANVVAMTVGKPGNRSRARIQIPLELTLMRPYYGKAGGTYSQIASPRSPTHRHSARFHKSGDLLCGWRSIAEGQ